MSPAPMSERLKKITMPPKDFYNNWWDMLGVPYETRQAIIDQNDIDIPPYIEDLVYDEQTDTFTPQTTQS